MIMSMGCCISSELMGADEGAMPAVKIAPDDIVALPYSSGTTGLPKGVMLTHRGLVTSISQQVDGDNPNLYFHKEDVIVCVLPLFHVYSLCSVMLCSLRVGCSHTDHAEIRDQNTAGARAEVQGDNRTIRPSNSAGTCQERRRGQELEDNIRAKLPNAILGQGYGMTEAGPVITMCLGLAKDPFKVKSGACRHCGEERGDEDRRPGDRVVVAEEQARRDLHQGRAAHERLSERP
ncbi:hypothetical protein MLD38_014040 [Melastoma candidum]|uniref:Uncharacterized protein n=1 Tax=Melastoma candidum TaxID=119954 RepID=A0ACB9RBF6_9MYRT|nr:hypothetical protein MLD38_014040 [Melastoma candidum]